MQATTYNIRRYWSSISAQLVQQEGGQYRLKAPDVPEEHIQLFLKISEELQRPIFGTQAEFPLYEETIVRFYVKKDPSGGYLIYKHAALTPAEMSDLNWKGARIMAGVPSIVILPIVGFIAGYCYYGWVAAIAGMMLGYLIGRKITRDATRSYFLDPNVNIHLFNPLSNVGLKVELLKEQYTQEQMREDLALGGVDMSIPNLLPYLLGVWGKAPRI